MAVNIDLNASFDNMCDWKGIRVKLCHITLFNRLVTFLLSYFLLYNLALVSDSCPFSVYFPYFEKYLFVSVSVCLYIVTCRMVRVTNNYGIRRMTGFINTLVTHALLITINYKQYAAIVVDLHFIQLAVAHALGFPVSTSRLPAMALNT
jgi:hypothetical protein